MNVSLQIHIWASTFAYASTHSEVSKRGSRTEGVGTRKSFLCHRFRPLFCTLLPIPHYEKGDTILGTFLRCVLGSASRQPANPFSKLLTHELAASSGTNICSSLCPTTHNKLGYQHPQMLELSHLSDTTERQSYADKHQAL